MAEDHDGRRADVGKRLKALRVGRGLTQLQLAEPLGITFQQIAKYESGASDLRISRLLALADVLEIPPSFLLDVPPASREEPRPINRLEHFRRERRLSRRAVSTAAGMSEVHLNGLESGRAELTVNWLIRLSDVLACHPWELVDPTFRPSPAGPAHVARRGRSRRVTLQSFKTPQHIQPADNP